MEIDKIDYYQNGYIVAVSNRKYGVLDLNGKVVIPFEYKNIGHYNENLFCAVKDDKYGYIDINNEWIIEPIYILAFDFSDGLASVVNEDLYHGYIDRNGTEVIPLQYLDAEPFSEGLAYVWIDNEGEDEYAFIDTTGKVVFETKYTFVSEFEYGVCEVTETEDSRLKGIINRDGELIIPCIYNYFFINQHYIEGILQDDTRVCFDKVGNIIDDTSNLLEEDDDIGEDDGSLFVLRENDRYRLMSQGENARILLQKCRYIKDLNYKRYLVCKSGWQAQVLDEKMNVIFECILSDIFYNYDRAIKEENEDRIKREEEEHRKKIEILANEQKAEQTRREQEKLILEKEKKKKQTILFISAGVSVVAVVLIIIGLL